MRSCNLKKARSALLMLLISFFIYASTGPTWTSGEPANGKIAFCSSRDGNWEIYVMNADGSNPTRLTHNSANDMDPSWSPDGKKIAFFSYRDGNYEIYLMNANGSSQTRLTHNSASDTYPDWSPDGKKIVFHSYRDGNWEIYVMNANGSNQTRLTNNPGNDWGPSWSPDGTKIAFHSSPSPRSYGDIYVMNADGSNKTRLTYTPADEQDPAWSPDGSKIAFESNRDGNYEIYVMNVDGSNPTRLTRNSVMDSTPTWSPDGTRLAFARDSCWEVDLKKCPGKSEIYIMDANGGNELRLTNNQFEDDMPDWLVVLIPNQPPQARFTFSPAQPTVGQSVTFDASTSSDPDGTISNYAWDFGDGSTSSGRITTHIYNCSGIFTVTLTVNDDDGVSASTSQRIEVTEAYTSAIVTNATRTIAVTLPWGGLISLVPGIMLALLAGFLQYRSALARKKGRPTELREVQPPAKPLGEHDKYIQRLEAHFNGAELMIPTGNEQSLQRRPSTLVLVNYLGVCLSPLPRRIGTFFQMTSLS